MNAFLPANLSDLWSIAGWTMVHFLWLGAIVAAVALVARGVLRHASPVIRYTVALSCLLALAALPIATAAWLTRYSVPSQGLTAGELDPAIAQKTVAAPSGLATLAPQNQVIELHVADASPVSNVAEKSAVAAALPAIPPAAAGSAGRLSVSPLQGETAQTAATLENPRQSRGLPGTKQSIVFADMYRRIEAYVAYLPWLWLVGTPLTFVLLVSGLVGTRRLGRASRPIDVADPIVDLLAHLAKSLRISQRVTVAVCERVAAPVLIGIVRPMILLPPAAITGWSPDEIEMVLLHELAHVRRWDNLVNLLQRCIESLLFFHPAVWFISSWVRHEREACCDALVVDRTNRPHAYAELIVALAAQLPRSVLFHPAASSAMAAGPLRSRIRRILKLEEDPMLISGKSLAMLLCSALVATGLAFYLPSTGHADQPGTTTAADSSSAAGESAKQTVAHSETHSDDAFDKKNDSPETTLLGKFGIDPTKELNASDVDNFGNLFQVIPTVNPIESRNYFVAPDKIKAAQATFDAILNGPLSKHIPFKAQWTNRHSIAVIEAPRLALNGFFDPLMREAAKSSGESARGAESPQPSEDEAKKNQPDKLHSLLPTFRRTTAEIEAEYLKHRAQQTPPNTIDGQNPDRRTGFYQWIFTVTDSNPLITQTFGVEPKWHDAVKEQLASLRRESWWKPEFTSNPMWKNADETEVDVTAPKTVVEMLQNQFEELQTGVVHQPGPLYQTADNQSSIRGSYANPNMPDQKVEAQSHNDLRNIALGLLVYEGQHDTLPPYASFSKDGQPLLSWRVLILPFIGEQQLYSEFNLGEPWDSAHNRELIDRMPAVFKNPKLSEAGKTNYLGILGPNCVFNRTASGVRLADITNGTSNTIAVVEVNKEFAVPWTKPADWSFDRNNPVIGLGNLWPFRTYAAYVDGSIKPVDVTKPADEISSHFVCSNDAARAVGESSSGATIEKKEKTSADDWPMGVAFPSPKEGEISRRAWRELQLKVVPANETERAAPNATSIKVVGAPSFRTVPANPVFLLSLNGIDADNFDLLDAALKTVQGQKLVVAKLVVNASANPVWTEIALDTSNSTASAPSPSPANNTNRGAANKFPSLDDQKLADVAWKMLGLELEPLGEADLKRVKALGYAGGVSIASRTGDNPSIYPGDILVGLHAWPTMSIRDVSTILGRDDIASLSPLKFYVVRVNGVNGTDAVVTGRIVVQSAGAQTFPQPFANQTQQPASASDDSTALNSRPDANQQLADALKKKSDAVVKRTNAKDHDAVEAAKRDLEEADRSLERVKRAVEAQSTGQPAPQPSGDPWPMSTIVQSPTPVTASNPYSSPYPPLIALPGETVQPALPRSRAEYQQMESAREHELMRIAQQTGSPQAQRTTSLATAPILPNPTPEELEILRDRVQTIEEEYKFTVERNKAGKGATDLDVARVACDLAEARSEVAFGEGNFDAAIKQLGEARDHAETAVKICTAGARAGDGNDFESVIKAKRKLSDIKLKLVRLQSPPYVAPRMLPSPSSFTAPSATSSQNRYPASLQPSAAEAQSQPRSPFVPTISANPAIPANEPVPAPGADRYSPKSADEFAEASAPSLVAPIAVSSTEPAAALQPSVSAPANADQLAPHEKSRLVAPVQSLGSVAATSAPASSGNQQFLLQLFYQGDDSKQLKLANRIQEESAKPLREKYQIDFAFIGTTKDAKHTLTGGQKVETLPTYAIYLNGKVVQQLHGPQTTEQLVSAIEKLAKENATTVKDVAVPSEPTGQHDENAADKSHARSNQSDANTRRASSRYSRDVNEDQPSDRTVVAYNVPAELVGDVKKIVDFPSGEVHGEFDNQGRYVLQANPERQKRFEQLLDATPKWRDPAAEKSRAEQIYVKSEKDGQEYLKWQAIGLTFTGKSNPEFKDSNPNGWRCVIVADVAPGSPGDWNGVEPGDVMTKIDGFETKSLVELESILKTQGQGYLTKDLFVMIFRSKRERGTGQLPGRFKLSGADHPSKQSKPADEPVAAQAQAASTVANTNSSSAVDPAEKPVLRYDGKPFAVWSSVFQNELSTEKRLEAVKALAAFARAGYQSEATDVVLDTVPQYDFGEISEGNPEGRLKQALIELIAHAIPAQYWLKPLRDRYDANPASWTEFADHVVPEASYSPDPTARELRQKFLVKLAEGENGSLHALGALINSDPKLTIPEIRALILKNLNGSQGQLATAIRALYSAETAPPELMEILLHADQSKQITARAALEQLGGGSLSGELGKAMGKILTDKSREKDRLAAIRTLAALGPNAQDPTIEKALRSIATSGSEAEKISAACALERITNGASQIDQVIRLGMDVNEKNAADLGAALETEQRTILGRKW